MESRDVAQLNVIKYISRPERVPLRFTAPGLQGISFYHLTRIYDQSVQTMPVLRDAHEDGQEVMRHGKEWKNQ